MFFGTQRLAVMISVARWTIFLLVIRQTPENKLQFYIKTVILIVGLIAVTMILSSAFHVFSLNQVVQRVAEIYSKIVIPFLPIPCYILLYLGLRRHYYQTI